MPRPASPDRGLPGTVDVAFYAQMKATTRVRDLTSGELRYQWTDNGALAHYRHAQAFDHIAGCYRVTANVYFF